MSFYYMRVADLLSDRAEAVERGLIPADWPIDGDLIARLSA